MELWVLGFCQVSAQREHSVWVHAEIGHPHKDHPVDVCTEKNLTRMTEVIVTRRRM